MGSECAGNPLNDPACTEAMRLLVVEEGRRAKSDRPPTTPRKPETIVHANPPPPDPVQVGARFEHRDWRWGG